MTDTTMPSTVATAEIRFPRFMPPCYAFSGAGVTLHLSRGLPGARGGKPAAEWVHRVSESGRSSRDDRQRPDSPLAGVQVAEEERLLEAWRKVEPCKRVPGWVSPHQWALPPSSVATRRLEETRQIRQI